MKKNNIKLLITALAITMSAGIFAGCGNKNNDNNSNQAESNKTEISGSITAAGSTALQPLAEQAAKQFTEKNPNATVTIQGGGSGTGLTQVMQGAVEIGNSDIFAEEKLKPEEAKQLVDHKVAVVGFGLVVNDKVNIDNLSKADTIKIFTGEITNWKEVGGNDLKITVINRPKSSGTRATFKKYALDGKEEVEGKALTQDSSGAVKKTIEETEGAIGYLATSYINDKANLSGVKVLKFDGVELNNENITNGKYSIWSYEHMYTKGEPSGLTKAFLDYMVSDEVKPIITKLGYIPVTDMKVTR
ncbi:phosphate ABC transporter substrate-binding protein, PhoT family [Clostridium sp. USBA 49]|uniref:phosphate ABC transporter substrate-binding protein n=1 Tax=Clostridium TaxID=1485 RepID=UPI00099A18DC|nr:MULTISPECIES: phosphate ABC transporter substrate-binding protein [Clostridium]SKA87245.1 phosphate ABC transporter substrate-binding protein, PhoT family [Clostridium sp. USBA 49]